MTNAAHPPRSGLNDGDAVAFVALVLGALAMGASPIFVRLTDVGPFSSAFWRVAIALPFLWVWMVRSAARGRTETGTAWRNRAVLLCGLAFAGDLFFWHLAIMNTTVANATFFATLSPVLVLLAGFLFFGRSILRTHMIGLLLCLTGGALLIGSSLRFQPDRLTGDVYGVITAFFFAAYILAAARARDDGVGAAALMFWSSAITAAVLLPIALIFDDVFWPQSVEGAAHLLALAVISQVGGQGLLAFALGALSANFTALVIFMEGISAAILGWIVLGEKLTLLEVLGALFIFTGVGVARHAARKPSQ
ncbi:MAG: DMT family transporter [Pseudomonadota bacterium]